MFISGQMQDHEQAHKPRSYAGSKLCHRLTQGPEVQSYYRSKKVLLALALYDADAALLAFACQRLICIKLPFPDAGRHGMLLSS